MCFILERYKTIRNYIFACEDQNNQCKLVKVLLILMMMHWQTDTQ